MSASDLRDPHGSLRDSAVTLRDPHGALRDQPACEASVEDGSSGSKQRLSVKARSRGLASINPKFTQEVSYYLFRSEAPL